MAGPAPGARSIRQRVAALDWHRVAHDLDAFGYARLPGFLTASECNELSALYERDERFRSTIAMEPRRFGIGEYRYFAYPLPRRVLELRRALYPPLARIANTWRAVLGSRERFPATLAGFLERCRSEEQRRPTPLLLRYQAGGLNHLHQDLYGAVAFPLQVAFLLKRPQRDFTGGEFLLVEQRPRQQLRGEAIGLLRGEGIVFPNAERPVRGASGFYRARVRHGVSRVRSGERLTCGIIFHDAR
jgi:hypothetical protein